MKVLALFHDIPRPDFDELKRLEEEDQTPRATIFTTVFNADVLDRKMLARAPRVRRAIYKFLPVPIAQIIEAFCIFRTYDLVLSWQEKIAFPFALLCKLTGSNSVPHVAMCSWPGSGVKARMLRLVHSQIDRLILWSSVQRDRVIHRVGVSPSKISFINYFVDDKFFRPLDRETDMICSVGSEMRDFPTLFEALRGLDIRCHIAAGTLNLKQTRWIRKVDRMTDLPPNITVGRKQPTELRELYARSRFVVIPLRPSDTDNGITCILEAMAMGKPVICSRTEGQVDVIKEGKTGIFVPVGDAPALRSAIEYLWNHPAEAERMGKEGLEYVLQYQRLDKLVGDVKRIVDEVLEERRRSRHSGR
jgi:glycosyltransferase involved in cell wall biosynthesis